MHFFFYCEYTYEYSYINFCEKEFCVKSDSVYHHGTKNKSGHNHFGEKRTEEINQWIF